jgi:putative radical SAM enzyme (TIGR03279 family)
MYEFAVTPAITQIRRRGVEVSEVTPASLAAELELEAGDRIIRVNGHVVRDYLDFRFQTGGETELTLEVLKRNGEEWELEIERGEGEDFGLQFENIVPRQCANECLFCFCHGNPPDARPALSFRDEDVRLSFLYGNYTTLTSITEAEMKRVIEQRLSPQYVSVHATDLDVRAYLLGVDKKRADIRSKMRRMLDAKIEIHAQVVLCPEINDGEILERTVRDLSVDYPTLRSVAIVPLGLTRYNTDARLTPVTPEFCRETIRQVKSLQRDLHARLGTNFAFLGDEFYLRAGAPVPSRRHYGDYPQIEDGVGMVRSFYEDFRRLERKLESKLHADAPAAHPSKLNGTILTGKLFAPELEKLTANLNNRFSTRFKVVAVENTYFGPDIVVAGLVTGRDVLAVRGQIEGDFVVLPSVMFKSDEPVMLDGTTREELERALGLPLSVLDFAGFSMLLLGG